MVVNQETEKYQRISATSECRTRLNDHFQHLPPYCLKTGFKKEHNNPKYFPLPQKTLLAPEAALLPLTKSQSVSQTVPQLPENRSSTLSLFASLAILRSTILLRIWLVDCAHNRPCRSAFSIPPGAPPSKAASHLLVSFRSPGLSCASCPAQSGPWQGGASLWNHTSQLFTLGSRHPTPHAVPLRSPHPMYFTPNVNGSFLEEKKKGEREGDWGTRKQLHAGRVLLGLGGTVRAAVTAGHGPQLKPRLSFIPVWFLCVSSVSFTG